MKYGMAMVSLLALAATLLPSILFWRGAITQDMASNIALGATLVWFVATPFWMGMPEREIDDESPMI